MPVQPIWRGRPPANYNRKREAKIEEWLLFSSFKGGCMTWNDKPKGRGRGASQSSKKVQ